MRLAWTFVLLGGCASFSGGDIVSNREPVQSLPLFEEAGVLHKVGNGETLFRIARAYGVSLDELIAVNDIDQPARLSAGVTIFVPGATEVRVVPPPSAEEARKEAVATNASKAALKEHLGGKLDWPVDGIVTSRFGARGARKHDGIDISAPQGTKITAAENGTVLYAGSQYRGYGNMIIVKHDGGLVTIYAHNSENLAREGDKVGRGQLIAKVGQTGRAEGPHLHFEVRQLDKPKNPLLYLP